MRWVGALTCVNSQARSSPRLVWKARSLGFGVKREEVWPEVLAEARPKGMVGGDSGDRDRMVLLWEAGFRQDALDFVLDGCGAHFWKLCPELA